MLTWLFKFGFAFLLAQNSDIMHKVQHHVSAQGKVGLTGCVIAA
jgi:hypothetical protein